MVDRDQACGQPGYVKVDYVEPRSRPCVILVDRGYLLQAYNGSFILENGYTIIKSQLCVCEV